MNPWPPPEPSPELRRQVSPWLLPQESKRSPGRWIGIVTPLLLLLFVVVTNIERTPDDPYPDTWDSRVLGLVSFVERERELTFDHPVDVEFLPTAEFDAGLVGLDGAGGLGGAPQADDDVSASTYDLLGLVDDFDADAARAANVASILGYFDGTRIRVRGEQLDAPVRAVLVHELTHALQAQHFDASLMYADTALALVEGDAVRIENRYVDTLGEDERAEIEALYLGDETTAASDDLPWTLGELAVQPYVVGPSFLAVVEADGGTKAVDGAFRSPPSEEQLLDPWQYLLSRPVAFVPELELDAPSGVRVVQSARPFGLFEALVLFDAWLPWQDTRRALDPWRDGKIVVFERDDETCAKVAIRVETTDDAERLSRLVADWADASGSDAVARVTDTLRRVVTFTSCSREGTEVPDAPSMTPSWSIVFENQFVSEFVEEQPDLDRRVTRCAARRLVDDPAFLAYIEADTDDDAAWNAYVDARDALVDDCATDPAAQSEL